MGGYTLKKNDARFTCSSQQHHNISKFLFEGPNSIAIHKSDSTRDRTLTKPEAHVKSTMGLSMYSLN
jgi:hypothetical protein